MNARKLHVRCIDLRVGSSDEQLLRQHIQHSNGAHVVNDFLMSSVVRQVDPPRELGQ